MTTWPKLKNPDGAPKILRIGIIQNGKIVEERLVRKRENVTIGQSTQATPSWCRRRTRCRAPSPSSS